MRFEEGELFTTGEGDYNGLPNRLRQLSRQENPDSPKDGFNFLSIPLLLERELEAQLPGHESLLDVLGRGSDGWYFEDPHQVHTGSEDTPVFGQRGLRCYRGRLTRGKLGLLYACHRLA